MCLGRAPGRGLRGLSPLASHVTLAHPDSIGLPVAHISVLALPISWGAVHCEVLRAWEMMPPCRLVLLSMGIQLVPMSYHLPAPSSLLTSEGEKGQRATSGPGLGYVPCVWVAVRSFEILFDVEAGRIRWGSCSAQAGPGSQTVVSL